MSTACSPDSSRSYLSTGVFVWLQLINQQEMAPSIDRRVYSLFTFLWQQINDQSAGEELHRPPGSDDFAILAFEE